MVKKAINKIFSKFYKDWKIETKMFWIFVLSVLLPIYVTICISYEVNVSNMTRQIDKLEIQNLRQIAERIKLTLDIYNTVLYQINADDEAIEYIQHYKSDESSSKAVAYNYIYNKLKQYNHSNIGMRSISIVSENCGPIIYDYQTGSVINNIWNGINLYEEAAYLDAKDKIGVILTSTQSYDDHGKVTYLFHLSKQIFNLNDLNKGPVATAIISIDSSMLNSICSEQIIKSNQDKYRIHFIVDSNRKIVSYPQLDFNGYQIEEGMRIEELVKYSGYFKNQDIMINSYLDKVTGWTYYNVYDKDYVLKDIKRFQHIYILMGITGILFAGALIKILIKRINRSIKNVVRGMEEVQKGNLDVYVQIEGRDEIGYIANTFNEMLNKVKKLINEVKSATDKQKDAEIRALEAQINPHFLYNTLESIKWMAVEKDAYEISEMITNLGTILRYSINKSNQMVSIEEVIDWLEKYLKLQRMRFNDAFEWILNIEEETKRVRIYKLLLQPFIENTIIHGFKGIEYGGILHVDVLMSQSKKTIQIIIQDNGQGISQDQVSLYNDVSRMIHQDEQGIGMQNVFSRMHMYYGNKASWNIKSILGMGTVIVLEFPVEEVWV